MVIGSLIIYLFGITSALYIAHFGFYLIGACIYDIWQSLRQRRQEQLMGAVTYQPLVTILVPAHNEEKVIERCLESIFASRYPRLSVIVVNDASTDNTRQILHNYAKAHREQSLRVVNKRRNGGKAIALNYALRRYVTSELVMMIDADSLLTPESLEHAVAYFTDPSIAGVSANVQIITQHTILGVLQKFEHMISYQSKKVYSIANCDYVIGGVASTYRTRVVRAVQFYDTDTQTEDISLSIKIVARGNRSHRLIYGADVVALTEPVATFGALLRQRYRWKYGSIQNLIKHSYLIDVITTRHTPMLTTYRLPMAVVTEFALLLLPLTWLYAVYITLAERSPLLVIGAYLLITFYTFLTLWYNTYLRRRERLFLSLYVPVMYFVFYIMDIVQITAVIRCLLQANRLRRHENTGSRWASPVRLGNELSVASSFVPRVTTARRIHK